MSVKPPTFVDGFSAEDEVAKMHYSCLGKTKLQVSKLSLGGGAFGGEALYGYVAIDHRDLDL